LFVFPFPVLQITLQSFRTLTFQVIAGFLIFSLFIFSGSPIPSNDFPVNSPAALLFVPQFPGGSGCLFFFPCSFFRSGCLSDWFFFLDSGGFLLGVGRPSASFVTAAYLQFTFILSARPFVFFRRAYHFFYEVTLMVFLISGNFFS